jgi:polysaccharide export outer membrane protein
MSILCRRFLPLGLNALVLLTAVPQGQAEEPTPPAVSPTDHAAPAQAAEMQLRPGDRLRFQIMEDPEAKAELTVNSSGFVDLPLLGLLAATGKPILAVVAEAKLGLEKEYYVKASVRLVLIDRPEKSSNRGRVYLSGQVRHMGTFEIDKAENNPIGKIILASGGLAEFADARRIRIIRKAVTGTDLKIVTVDLDEILTRGRIDKDIPLFDGDFVIVDSKLINW